MERGFDRSQTRSDRSLRNGAESRRKSTESGTGYERGEKRIWERASTPNDFHSKKTRDSEPVGEFEVGIRDAIPEGDLRLKISKRKRDVRDQKTSHRDLRHRIKNKSKKCRTFSEEGSCNKYGGEHSNQERLREVGGEFIYLRDKTCTVETLDVEEHFSKDRDVVKVKFIGKEGGSHIFKLVVTAAWQSNQMRSFHTIRGVDLEVESRIRRPSTLKGESSFTGSYLSKAELGLPRLVPEDEAPSTTRETFTTGEIVLYT